MSRNRNREKRLSNEELEVLLSKATEIAKDFNRIRLLHLSMSGEIMDDVDYYGDGLCEYDDDERFMNDLEFRAVQCSLDQLCNVILRVQLLRSWDNC